MHVQVIGTVFGAGMHLLAGCKPHQTFVIQVDLQGTLTGHDGVQPDIKLVIIHQQWVGHLFTHNHLGSVQYLCLLVRNLDALALRHVGGFHDVPLVVVLLHVGNELGGVSGHDLGGRQEVEPFLALVVLHPLHVFEHVVLAGQFIAGREVVDALVPLQTAEYNR